MKKSLLFAAALFVGASAWAEDWNTVWFTDFSTAPQGMTYSVSNGSVDISTGVLFYHQGGGTGNRAINTAFTADAFKVDTNWQMEFDWGASSANTNPSNVAFATDKSTAFTIVWASYAVAATITDADGTELPTTLPIDGYNKATMTNLSHFTITGDTENGIYLTVTNNGETYVDNVKVSSTFGYPSTFNGSLGRAVSHMALDNIYFKVPAVAGFVAAPTATITGVNGASRTLTLETLTEGATILWSETAPESNDYSAWTAYNESATTTADPIYAVATDGTNYSEVSIIETGAGVAITLNAPVVSVDGFVANGSLFNPVFSASNSQADILLTPTTSLTATFNGTAVELPFTATENGALVITAAADGYAAASTEIAVYGQYEKTWVSTDYSTLTADNVASVLGEAWALQEGTGRWASWPADKEPYTYYQVPGDVTNIKVEQNLKMRNVIQLNLGYGLARNISGKENIEFLNTKQGTIAEVKYYNGYGAEVSEENTHLTYTINATGESIASYGTNGGNVLVQATYYEPIKKSIFLKPNIWDVEDATERYAAYVWNATGSEWINLTVTDEVGIYSANIPQIYTGLIFTRISADAENNIWENVWNQTADIDFTAVADNTLFTITGWGEGDDAKSTYETQAYVEPQTFTVTFINKEEGGWADVYVYTWTETDGTVYEFEGAWPGKQLTANEDGTYTYSVTAVEAPEYIIFHNNAGVQSDNLQFVNGETYTINADGKVVTGIETAKAAAAAKVIYNLAGQRVQNAQKGLYIVNGKKVVKK